ncbi:MAG: hypothetical protein M3O67_00440 [Bacteroidota bacterium]|nr:hypothetical protein [Bacteroidota bacterium]
MQQEHNSINSVVMILAASTLLFASCNLADRKGKNGIVYKTAAQYNNYIVDRQKSVAIYITDFSRMVQINPDSAEYIRNKAIQEIDTSITGIKGMPSFKGDTILRDVAINSFLFYRKLFMEEYKEIVTIFKKGPPISLQDQMFVKDLSLEIARQEEKYDRALHNAQYEFARKNNMQLK